ncbi:hypothetical protein OC834_005534, partial [Tilletia horrida]
KLLASLRILNFDLRILDLAYPIQAHLNLISTPSFPSTSSTSSISSISSTSSTPSISSITSTILASSASWLSQQQGSERTKVLGQACFLNLTLTHLEPIATEP